MKISELLDNIEKKDLVLPEFQMEMYGQDPNRNGQHQHLVSFSR